MKNFKNPKEMYLKVVSLQDEVKDSLQNYIEKENVSIKNFEEKLYKDYEKVAEHIFDELNDGKSENMSYLTDNMENLDGDAQIISVFIKAYITDRLMSEIVSFEELETSDKQIHETKEKNSRYLIVIENKENQKRFLFNPFNGDVVVPFGYRKITQGVPLNEDKYGHLAVLELLTGIK